jgi:hypothetical protein
MNSHEDLLAKDAINDALLRYCSGIDRGDLALILSAFHDDAVDNHSGFEESAVERFTRTTVDAKDMVMKTSHQICNVLIQLDGSTAAVQSYMTARHQFPHQDKTFNWVIAGRYVDRFERRIDEWRIVHRTVVYDFEWFDEAGTRPMGHPTEPFLSHVVRGERGRGDYSFSVLRA